ncbi:uncharacterized protein LOC122320273 [Drosophila ficusphila]|uniref:uncharacterized protein LOC122320273 n=1 Tax=Drosophila ficusphila TaxID=30025 RepID=UPI001C8938A1|nr:uncharacterized protein LOC122320273 [Drosophila ficusphila]
MSMDTTLAAPVAGATYYKLKAGSMLSKAKAIEKTLTADKLQEMSEEKLEFHVQRLDEIKTAFFQIHDRLEELDFNEIGSVVRDDFEELIISTKIRLNRELGKRKGPAIRSSTLRPEPSMDFHSMSAARRSHLPELRLPDFSGGYTEFADFQSMFKAIIDNDVELSNIEKLQHLKSCLKGAALDTVRSLEICEINYAVAWELLNNRFNNKRLIFQSHINAILSLPKVDMQCATKLREMSDKINANLRALQSMGSVDQIANCVLVHVLLQRLDSKTQANWEESAAIDEIPSIDHFTTFLSKRCRKLENIEHTAALYSNCSPSGITRSRSILVATNTSGHACVACDSSSHSIYSCGQFANLSTQERILKARDLALCFNCLKKGHQMRNCRSGCCRVCGSKHHSLLHPGSQPSTDVQRAPVAELSTPNAIASSPSISLLAQNLDSDSVFLPTAAISIQSRSGAWIPCRTLLDSGSQVHVVTSRLAHQLELPKTKSTVTVAGLGDARFDCEGASVCLKFKSHASNNSACLTALVAPAITENQPSSNVKPDGWKIPSSIQLADPEFYKSHRIDLFIGASMFFELLSVGQIKLAAGLPLLQNSRLGWIVTGGGSSSTEATGLQDQAVHRELVAARMDDADDLIIGGQSTQEVLGNNDVRYQTPDSKKEHS